MGKGKGGTQGGEEEEEEEPEGGLRRRRGLGRRRGKGRRGREERGERGKGEKEFRHISRPAPQVEDLEVGRSSGAIKQVRHRVAAEATFRAHRIWGASNPVSIVLQ